MEALGKKQAEGSKGAAAAARQPQTTDPMTTLIGGETLTAIVESIKDGLLMEVTVDGENPLSQLLESIVLDISSVFDLLSSEGASAAAKAQAKDQSKSGKAM